jgi:PAS domain S-box-containing protein
MKKSFHVKYSWVSIGLGIYALVGGLSSLLGWAIDIPRFTDWFNLGISIQPNAALAVTLAALALVLMSVGHVRVPAVLGGIAGAIGFATLLEHGLRVDLGIDTLLTFNRPWGSFGTTVPGRMGLPASVSWTLLGIAFLCAAGGKREIRQLSSGVGLVVALISFLSLIGFVFGADTLYTLPAVTAIAIQTASFLFAISLGLVVTLRDVEPMRTLIAPTGAGLLARRALPVVFFVPVVVGILRQAGETIGLYDTRFGSALRTAVEIVVLTLMLWWAVRAIREREAQIEATSETLALSERDLSDFFENASVGLHWVGPDGTILRANKAELELLGYTKEEYVGRHIADFHVDPPVIEDILERLGRGEILHDHPARMRCKDGRILDVLIDSSVLFDDGDFVHTRCFTRDVTKQKQAERALREADRRKDEFLATLAHELRNPLAPISNSLQLMRLADRDAKLADEAREVAERQVEHMVRLIDDLLDLSRITRNKLELRKERIDLNSVVNNAIGTCLDMIRKKGHVLEIASPKTVVLNADPVRITQIITNLINNASKFTGPGGRISVSVDSDGQRAVIRVKDTGVGIPKDKLGEVFDMFTQVDRSLEKTEAGLGIGLSLTKRLVELHDGSITALSDGVGTGSEFVVELPATSLDVIEQTVEAPVTNVPTKRRILVVDDNADSAESLALLLRIQGNDTQIARDGIEAVEKAAEYKPDVILLDIGMPGMNGYEACQAIRRESWGTEALVIAMTGWGQAEDRRRSAEAGFDHHLVKPIDHAELLRLLASDTAAGVSLAK